MVNAAANLLGSKMQADAAKDAAQTQAEYGNRALDLQEEMYNQQRADFQPWRQAGLKALGGLGNSDFQRDFTAADFQKDPGYEFRMREGQKALERSAAARGGLQSGGTLKALARYGQDYASNEFGNAYNRFNADRDRRFNRLSSLAGLGQTATGAVANAAQNFGTSGAQSLTGIGNAMGAGQLGAGQAWGQGIQNIGNNWMQMQMAALGAGSRMMGGK